MTDFEFKEWPKTSRLESPCVITEKLDGANGCIVIQALSWQSAELAPSEVIVVYDADADQHYGVVAQSRTRLAFVGKDETGIAVWVRDRADQLVRDLGPGWHYGEFMKKGLKAPRFYLFNTGRWGGVDFQTPDLYVVPVLFEGEYREGAALTCLEFLRTNGSLVHPGIPAEGIVIFWKHDQSMKKVYTGLLKKGK